MSLRADFVYPRGGFRLAIDLATDARKVVLVGPNGSGKSAFLRVLAGLVHPKGSCSLQGVTLFDAGGGFLPPDARRIGYVPQGISLFPHLNVAENVAFGLCAQGQPRTKAHQGALAFLERIGMSAFADRRPHQLSGGEAQKVAIARALVVKPATLLLDEPLSALDVVARHEMAAFVQTFVLELDDLQLVWATHSLRAVPGDAYLVVLEHGKCVEHGPLQDLAHASEHPFTQALMQERG